MWSLFWLSSASLCAVGCLTVCSLFVASVFVVLLCRDLTTTESRVKVRPNKHGLFTYIQVNVNIGNTVSWLNGG